MCWKSGPPIYIQNQPGGIKVLKGGAYGAAPRQVTDMLVVFKTPAWVLEIAGKTHQTRPQITILIVIEVCALQLRRPHMLGSSSELWYRYTVLKRFLTVIL